jgi:GRB2-associated-binding protein 1
VVHLYWQFVLSRFHQKWKQRYFVLHKPSGSLPDQYELSYFSSDACNKKKGTIDLDQCEQIIESLDSDQYPHLLAIKTICRGKVRVARMNKFER